MDSLSMSPECYTQLKRGKFIPVTVILTLEEAGALLPMQEGAFLGFRSLCAKRQGTTSVVP
jgi:hypothetical protein